MSKAYQSVTHTEGKRKQPPGCLKDRANAALDFEFHNPIPDLMCRLWKALSPERCISKLLKEKRK